MSMGRGREDDEEIETSRDAVIFAMLQCCDNFSRLVRRPARGSPYLDLTPEDKLPAERCVRRKSFALETCRLVRVCAIRVSQISASRQFGVRSVWLSSSVV